MSLFSRAYTRRCGFFYQAEGKVSGAGGEQLTLKQQLEAAETAKTKAEQAKADAEQKLKDAEQNAADLQSALDKAAGKLTAAEGEVTKLKGDLKTASERVTTLEGEAKDADERGRETAAASGVKPVPKSEDAPKGGAADGKSLFAEYQKLMASEDPKAASAYFDQHEKALVAFMNSKEAQG